jgi:hypothetical protein
MEAYKFQDVTVIDDAVALIRRRRAMYLPSDTPGPYLAGKLVQDIALLGALPARVARDGEWWLVSADQDWLCTISGAVSTEPFFRIVPCPQWGRYAFRTEVLLTAFAEAVVIAADAGPTWIAGQSAGADPPSALRAPGAGRRVAFRLAPEGAARVP